MNCVIYSVLVSALLGFPAVDQFNSPFGATSPNALNKAYYADYQTSPTPCTTTSAAPTATPTAPVHLEYNGLVLPNLDDPLPAPKGNDTEEEKKKKEETGKQGNQADQGKIEFDISSGNSANGFMASANDPPVNTEESPNADPQANPLQFQQLLNGQQSPAQIEPQSQPQDPAGQQPQLQSQPQSQPQQLLNGQQSPAQIQPQSQPQDPAGQQPQLQSQPQQANMQWNPFKPGAFVTYNLENKPVTPFTLGRPQTFTIVPTKEEQQALAAKNKAAAEASKKMAQDSGLKPQQGQQSQPGQPLPQLQPQQGQQSQQKPLPQMQGMQPRPQQFLQGLQPNILTNFLNMPATYFGGVLGGRH
jgi:hypothetical protein